VSADRPIRSKSRGCCFHRAVKLMGILSLIFQTEWRKPMKNSICKCLFLTAVALLCFGSSTLADTVSVTFTGAGPNNLGGGLRLPVQFDD
jgi:hypothetical protein